MGKVFSAIDDKLREWITRQRLFFTATAPLAGEGLVNCSPKGYDAFRILDPTTVAYLDLTGSGVETIAHLRENGRITIMFCAFEGGPRIVRLYGRGDVLELGTPAFDELMAHFTPMEGMRSIIRVHLTRIADSCGFSVPYYEYKGERETLLQYAAKEGEDGMAVYRQKNNVRSLDGLPGLDLDDDRQKATAHGA